MRINYKKEIVLRGIKLIDIGYITAIYMLLGILAAKLCDKYFGEFDADAENKKPFAQSMAELILYLWFIGIVIYIVRNLVPLVPFPLDGIYGFDHLKVKEVTSAATFAVAFIYFQVFYQQKLKHVFSRISL